MDTTTIIWLIVIVGAVIFGSFKAKKESTQGSMPSAKPNGEAWPGTLKELLEQATDKPASEPVARPAVQPPTIIQTGMGPDSQEIIVEDFMRDIPDTIDLSPALSLETDAGFEAERQSRRPVADEQPATRNANTDIVEDFDLRTAVIYAEILKPKFQER